MSFNAYRRYLKDTPGSYREQKKNLPFTVTDIGGKLELEAWKLKQEAREIEWQKEKNATRSRVIAAMEDGSLANKHFGESQTTKDRKRYEEDQERTLIKAAYTSPPEPKLGILTRFVLWCLHKFLNIQYN